MYVVALRTDKPEAEIGIFTNGNQQDYITWQAHRQLAETIHHQMNTLLSRNNLTLADIGGVVVYEGPGSFTGLRIGMSVANALAYSLNVPIAADSGEEWIPSATKKLTKQKSGQWVAPFYGGEAHVTRPKK